MTAVSVFEGRVAQPPGSPERAGVARAGVELPSAVLVLISRQSHL